MEEKRKEVTNEHLATLFFAVWVAYMVLAAMTDDWTKLIYRIGVAISALVIGAALKTWGIIREVQHGY